MIHICGSIVLYNNRPEIIQKVISSFLHTSLNVRLFLVDNSETNECSKFAGIDERIEYIFNNRNTGYGSGHNVAIRKSMELGIPYHLVLNPDVYYETGALETIYSFMQNHPDVGQLMPQVLYPDGRLQYLCKLLPTPFILVFRRVLLKWFHESRINKRYELRFSGYDTLMDIPALSGCFMLLRTSVLREAGLFDERFFMYLEDIDLTRRMGQKSRTVFYPGVKIYHEHNRRSYRELLLLREHLVSAVKYFNKWGWFIDRERRRTNKETLLRLGYYRQGRMFRQDL
jgi:GT2 family glycosyltransferase